MDTEEHKKKTDIAICFGALNLQQKTNLEERDGNETKQKEIHSTGCPSFLFPTIDLFPSFQGVIH